MLISSFLVLSKMIESLDSGDKIEISIEGRGNLFYNQLAICSNLRLWLDLARGKNQFLTDVYKRVLNYYMAGEIEAMNKLLLNETNKAKNDRIIAMIIDRFRGVNNNYAERFMNGKEDKISLKFSQSSEEKVEISRSMGIYKVEYIRSNGKVLKPKYNIDDEISQLKSDFLEAKREAFEIEKTKPGFKYYEYAGVVNARFDLKTDMYIGDAEEFKVYNEIHYNDETHLRLLAFNLYKNLIKTGQVDRGTDSFLMLYGSAQKVAMTEEYLR